VARIVDAKHVDLSADNVDLVDCARLLGNAPIGRERLVQQLEK